MLYTTSYLQLYFLRSSLTFISSFYIKTCKNRDSKEYLHNLEQTRMEKSCFRRNGYSWDTWDLVNKLEKKTPIRWKWVFVVKYKLDISIYRYKARLVAKEFTQTYKIDYQETFTLVTKLNTVRILLSLAVNLYWHIQQLYIKNVFLNGDLEEVYIDLSSGFDKERKERKVYKLKKKSLYGLKQLPQAWFERFRKVILQLGYK